MSCSNTRNVSTFSVSATVQQVQSSFCANDKINTYTQERGQNKGQCDREKQKCLLKTPC